MHDALERAVDDAGVEGWQLHEEHSDTKVTLIKRKTGSLGGHAIIFLLAGWWTLGIANLVYLAYKYFADADKKIIRHPDDTTDITIHDTRGPPSSTPATDAEAGTD